MGKKSKTRMREMQEMNDPNLDLMTVTPPTTQTPMSYATAVKSSEPDPVTTNPGPRPAPRTTSGGTKTKGDGSHNPSHHPVSPMKVDGADSMNLNNQTLPRSPSPNSDPLIQIRESLRDFELPELTESSGSDGEFHLSTFRMLDKRAPKAELLSQDDVRFIRSAHNHLTNGNMKLTEMISILTDAITATEDNLRYMRRTVRRMDKEVRNPPVQVMLYADLSDTMVKSFTSMLHAFWTQVQKLEAYRKTIKQVLFLVPRNRLHPNTADLPTGGRKNRRRKHKGNCPDDKQPRDPATSTPLTGEGQLPTGN